ncbi:hypothetical protein [Rhizobium sp. BK316]|uniref:hypothetical protein n=1 Tax=Rhizobium sp. BK316 TaxID=2587053 RepID=UPI00160A09F4|nr:hypothetical protein [Rhizobium sp. BK316]
MTELPISCVEARGTFAVDYEMRDPAEPWNRDPYELFNLACWYGEKQFKALWPETKDTPFAELSVAQYNSLGWTQTEPAGAYTGTKLAALPPHRHKTRHSRPDAPGIQRSERTAAQSGGLEEPDQPGGADHQAGNRHQHKGAHENEKDPVLHNVSSGLLRARRIIDTSQSATSITDLIIAHYTIKVQDRPAAFIPSDIEGSRGQSCQPSPQAMKSNIATAKSSQPAGA